jgi:tetratricopeptide (TPR) repeat protein
MKRLTDRDTADSAFKLRLVLQAGPFIMVGLCGVEFYFFGPRFIWFILPDIALTTLLIWGLHWFLDGAARAAGNIYLPSGKGSPTPREYSEQQALVIRGRYTEAADSYRAIIEDDPADIDARLRLGALLEEKCGDPDGAEACYLGIRALGPTPQQEWLVSNALIDLYHREARQERLKAELDCVARRHAGTGAGASAQRRLQELLDDEGSTMTHVDGVP